MFQLVCQQAEKGQHLPEGDAAHCSCCSPAVRVLLLHSTVRSTKENNSCFIYTYICVLVCVCCPFCACNFSFVANSNRFLSAALGALSSFRTTGHGHFSPVPPTLSSSLSCFSLAALNSFQHAERTACGIRNLNVNINLSVKQLVCNYATT